LFFEKGQKTLTPDPGVAMKWRDPIGSTPANDADLGNTAGRLELSSIGVHARPLGVKYRLMSICSVAHVSSTKNKDLRTIACFAELVLSVLSALSAVRFFDRR